MPNRISFIQCDCGGTLNVFASTTIGFHYGENDRTFFLHCDHCGHLFMVDVSVEEKSIPSADDIETRRIRRYTGKFRYDELKNHSSEIKGLWGDWQEKDIYAKLHPDEWTEITAVQQNAHRTNEGMVVLPAALIGKRVKISVIAEDRKK